MRIQACRGFHRAAALVALVVIAAAAGGTRSAAAGGSACHVPPAQTGRGDAILMEKNCFVPTTLEVAVGTKVVFANRDAGEHVIRGVAMGLPTSPGAVPTGGSWAVAFTSPGVYPYACDLHAGMVGAVLVVDSGRGESTGAASLRSDAEAPGMPALTARAGDDPLGAVGLALGVGTVVLVIGAILFRARVRPGGK